MLRHRFPATPNLGDFTQIDSEPWRGKVDILWGSTPCQSFSSQGSRGGLSHENGSLALSFVDLADGIKPPFVCYENMRGMLSDGANAFGVFLARLAGETSPALPPSGRKWSTAGFVLGPHRAIAWRVFDAQFSGLPQHRERLFVVGCARSRHWHDPLEILFERSSPLGFAPTHVEKSAAYAEGDHRGAYYINGDTRPKVNSSIAHTLKAGGSLACVVQDGHIRHLTPIEWERLQGMPDDWTLVPYKSGMLSDRQRRKLVGNSLAIPDVRFIGERILAVASSAP